MSDADPRRCRRCGALVGVDAEWCGQCFSRLSEPEPEPDLPAAKTAVQASSVTGAAGGEAYWPCPVCEHRNPIAADACETCGTPFSVLMRSEEAPRAAPGAVVWSLVFPGLGHHRAGRTMDGIARAVLFAVSAAMALMMGFGSLDSGIALAVFIVFVVAALAVYAISLYEAYRLSIGGDLIIPSRVLMWVVVGLILLSVSSLTIAFVTATRR